MSFEKQQCSNLRPSEPFEVLYSRFSKSNFAPFKANNNFKCQ